MAAGGKPLWYIQMGTTGAILFLTIFFVSVMASWRSGVDEVVADPSEALGEYPKEKLPNLIKCLADFSRRISGSTFYFPLIVGLTVAGIGAWFGYSLYKEKVSDVHGLIWFGSVCSFTLVWMVTTIIFYVDVTFIGGKFNRNNSEFLNPPLSSIYAWGRESSGTTAQMLIVWPTAVFLFLSFVAYRLYIKLTVFGNLNPDVVGQATETKPGSWFDRQTGAEGGTWQREASESVVAPPVATSEGIERTDNEELKPVVTAAGAAGGAAGWGNWLEDVFDYTF